MYPRPVRHFATAIDTSTDTGAEAHTNKRDLYPCHPEPTHNRGLVHLWGGTQSPSLPLAFPRVVDQQPLATNPQALSVRCQPPIHPPVVLDR